MRLSERLFILSSIRIAFDSVGGLCGGSLRLVGILAADFRRRIYARRATPTARPEERQSMEGHSPDILAASEERTSRQTPNCAKCDLAKWRTLGAILLQSYIIAAQRAAQAHTAPSAAGDGHPQQVGAGGGKRRTSEQLASSSRFNSLCGNKLFCT